MSGETVPQPTEPQTGAGAGTTQQAEAGATLSSTTAASGLTVEPSAPSAAGATQPAPLEHTAFTALAETQPGVTHGAATYLPVTENVRMRTNFAPQDTESAGDRRTPPEHHTDQAPPGGGGAGVAGGGPAGGGTTAPAHATPNGVQQDLARLHARLEQHYSNGGDYLRKWQMPADIRQDSAFTLPITVMAQLPELSNDDGEVPSVLRATMLVAGTNDTGIGLPPRVFPGYQKVTMADFHSQPHRIVGSDKAYFAGAARDAFNAAVADAWSAVIRVGNEKGYWSMDKVDSTIATLKAARARMFLPDTADADCRDVAQHLWPTSVIDEVMREVARCLAAANAAFSEALYVGDDADRADDDDRVPHHRDVLSVHESTHLQWLAGRDDLTALRFREAFVATDKCSTLFCQVGPGDGRTLILDVDDDRLRALRADIGEVQRAYFKDLFWRHAAYSQQPPPPLTQRWFHALALVVSDAQKAIMPQRVAATAADVVSIVGTLTLLHKHARCLGYSVSQLFAEYTIACALDMHIDSLLHLAVQRSSNVQVLSRTQLAQLGRFWAFGLVPRPHCVTNDMPYVAARRTRLGDGVWGMPAGHPVDVDLGGPRVDVPVYLRNTINLPQVGVFVITAPPAAPTPPGYDGTPLTSGFTKSPAWCHVDVPAHHRDMATAFAKALCGDKDRRWPNDDTGYHIVEYYTMRQTCDTSRGPGVVVAQTVNMAHFGRLSDEAERGSLLHGDDRVATSQQLLQVTPFPRIRTANADTLTGNILIGYTTLPLLMVRWALEADAEDASRRATDSASARVTPRPRTAQPFYWPHDGVGLLRCMELRFYDGGNLVFEARLTDGHIPAMNVAYAASQCVAMGWHSSPPPPGTPLGNVQVGHGFIVVDTDLTDGHEWRKSHNSLCVIFDATQFAHCPDAKDWIWAVGTPPSRGSLYPQASRDDVLYDNGLGRNIMRERADLRGRDLPDRAWSTGWGGAAGGAGGADDRGWGGAGWRRDDDGNDGRWSDAARKHTLANPWGPDNKRPRGTTTTVTTMTTTTTTTTTTPDATTGAIGELQPDIGMGQASSPGMK